MESCCRNCSEVGPVDFVDLVHLETVIAYTINTLFHDSDGKQKGDPSAIVDNLCKELKGRSKKFKVTIEANR